MTPSRTDAWALLSDFVQSESLRKHCLCVEAAMRAYARAAGENEDLWGVVGLLHDFDYEKYPFVDAQARSGHPFEGAKILRAKGVSEEIVKAVLSHASYSTEPRDSAMKKTLFAVDELSGFIMAVAHMRPTRFAGMTAETVEKRLKNKAFAAKVSRTDIEDGIRELGIDRKEHIERVIAALAGIESVLFPAI